MYAHIETERGEVKIPFTTSNKHNMVCPQCFKTRKKKKTDRERETDCQESYTQLSNTTHFIASNIRMTMGIFSALKTVPCWQGSLGSLLGTVTRLVAGWPRYLNPTADSRKRFFFSVFSLKVRVYRRSRAAVKRAVLWRETSRGKNRAVTISGKKVGNKGK